jgi:type IV pilus assembly protein PilO
MAKQASAVSTLDRLSLPAKAGLGFFVMVLVALFYFILFYGDVDKDIAAQQQTEAALRAQLQEAEESKELYQKDLDEKTRRQQLAKEQKKILPDNAETPSFLSAVQSVATVSGINLTAYSPTEEIPLEFYAKVPMSLKATGKFHQMAKFFHGIGQLDRIINVEDIQMNVVSQSNADDAEDNEIRVEVSCLATAFRALKDGEAGTAQRARGRGTGKK